MIFGERKHGEGMAECPICPLKRTIDQIKELAEKILGQGGRTFPLMPVRGVPAGPLRIPWAMAEEAYAEECGARQSLAAVAKRGGFYWDEMDRFLPGWRERVDLINALRAELLTAQERMALATAEISALRERAERQQDLLKALSDFQADYEKNTLGNKMPGNEHYASLLMDIVTRARAELETPLQHRPKCRYPRNQVGEGACICDLVLGQGRPSTDGQGVASALQTATPTALELRGDKVIGTFEIEMPVRSDGWSCASMQEWIRSLVPGEGPAATPWPDRQCAHCKKTFPAGEMGEAGHGIWLCRSCYAGFKQWAEAEGGP